MRPELVQAEEKLKSGDIKSAAGLCQKVVMEDTKNADALNMLGLIALQVGKLDSAENYFTRAADTAPQNPAFQLNLGSLRLRQNRAEDALAHVRKAAELAPKDIQAHTFLASIYARLGDAPQAAHHYEEAGLILALRENPTPEDFSQAGQAFYKALEYDPNLTLAHLNLGVIASRFQRPDKAVEHLEKATQLAPHSVDAWLNLAHSYYALSRTEDALKACETTIRLDPSCWRAYGLKTLLLEIMNRLDEAKQVMEEAWAKAPGDTGLLIARAKLSRRLGDLADAKKQLEALFSRVGKGAQQVHEYAKVLEAEKNYKEAFEHFAQANLLMQASLETQRQDKTASPALIEKSQNWFTRERVKGWDKTTFNDGLPSPVFLVGFPRSGTTLTEQMFASHPNFAATQEAELLQGALKRHITENGLSYPEALADANPAILSAMRRFYWDSAEAKFGVKPGAKRLLDKMPMNITLLGVINRIFPEAKVLVALRDPRDVVLSCFSQAFVANTAMVHFFTLEDAARYYAQVMGLWLHYKKHLSVSWREFRYEDTVANPEKQMRGLLEFVGEPWSDEVMRFHEADKNRNVRTPSYEGVMKPVYKSAAGKWKNYEKQMAPILPVLEPFVQTFGYGGGAKDDAADLPLLRHSGLGN